MKYVDEKRDEFFQLNFYTMDQIVILQKELSAQNDNSSESNRLYPLLSLANGNCSKKDVDKAKRKVQTKIDEEKIHKQLQDFESTEKSSKETQEETQKKNFIAKLVKSGISKKLAMIALLSGIKPTEPNRGEVFSNH